MRPSFVYKATGHRSKPADFNGERPKARIQLVGCYVNTEGLEESPASDLKGMLHVLPQNGSVVRAAGRRGRDHHVEGRNDQYRVGMAPDDGGIAEAVPNNQSSTAAQGAPPSALTGGDCALDSNEVALHRSLLRLHLDQNAADIT